jgi:hypothetical protein
MTRKPKSAITRILAVLAIVAVLAFPLYVLSIGPAEWLADHGYIDFEMDSPVEQFYRPVGQAMILHPWVNRPMKCYLSFWRPPEPPPNQ